MANTEKIEIINDEIAYDGKYLQMLKRHFIGSKGEPAFWEMVRRKIYGRIVAIAALTPEKEIILEKIYRVPLRSYVIELPTGLTDIQGESCEEAIRRELLEETGYEVDELEPLLVGPFNVGLVEDEMTIYYGKNARRIKEPILENSEDIEVIKVPFEKLRGFLMERDGVKKDFKIAAVIPFLERKLC